MGLDASLRIIPASFVENCGDTTIDESEDVVFSDFTEMKYWRKNQRLQQWMTELYIRKGGTNTDFNGPYLRLHKTDIESLVEALKSHKMPEGYGFFWGQNDYNQEDLEFFTKLLALHNFQKYALVYDANY